MGFFDFNIPYNESDRNVSAANKSKLKAHRLKLVIKIAELGYTGVAYNRVIKGVMSESDRCSISLFPLSSLLKIAPSLSNSLKFHRELLNVSVSTPFRQYTRLTVVIESPAQAASLNSGNPILKSYDIVAVRPMNQTAFEHACQTSEVDVIAIDFTERLPFRLKQPMVKAAIERGVYFEITYAGLITDAQMRRQMISSAKLLVEWTNGKNIIVSSAAPSVSEIRGPYDVSNLLSLYGFKSERAKASVSKNCRCVIANSLRKKHYFKEAIKVELMPSGETPVDDWLNWDPISSGEGDLVLDDIKKCFSGSDNVLSKPIKVLQFASALKSLPSHGFQVKDIIPEIDTISEKSNGGNFFRVEDDTKGISENSLELDLLHEKGRASSVIISPSYEELENVENAFDVEEMEAKDSVISDLRDNDSVHVEDDHCSVVSSILCEFSKDSPEALITPGESEMQQERSVDGHAVSVPVEEDKSVLNWLCEKTLYFMLPDDPSNQEFRGIKLENSEKPADESQVEVFVDNIKEKNRVLYAESESSSTKYVMDEEKKFKRSRLVTDEDTPLESTSGKGHRKKKKYYKPFLSPFKNLLISKRSRKKIRYLNVLNSV